MAVVQSEYRNTQAMWGWAGLRFWENDSIRVTLKTGVIHEGGFVAGPTTNFRGIKISSVLVGIGRGGSGSGTGVGATGFGLSPHDGALMIAAIRAAPMCVFLMSVSRFLQSGGCAAVSRARVVAPPVLVDDSRSLGFRLQPRKSVSRVRLHPVLTAVRDGFRR